MLRFVRLPERGVTPLHTDAAGTLPPDAFGPFRVLHQVGAGALGPVFRAYDPEHDRLVALKLIRLDMPPERAHALVAELGRIIDAGLTHPILAAPIATGLADVTPFLAQEFVSADSLDLVVRDYGPPPPAEALRVATQLAGALDFCAAAEVYHGALHPRDVLVSSDDTRLTGIGLAQAFERAGLAATLRRPYTAPERAAGLPWSRTADVFSLAAVIYEMLTGRRIAGVGERAASGLGDIAGLNNAALRSVFTRALAERADERFPSTMAFADALREVIPERGAAAAPPSPSAEPTPAIHVQPATVDAPAAPVKTAPVKASSVKADPMRAEPATPEPATPEPAPISAPKQERTAREPVRSRKERIVEEDMRLPLDAEPIHEEIDRRLAARPAAPAIDDLTLAPAPISSATEDNRFDDVLFERELEEVKQMVAAEPPAQPPVPEPAAPNPLSILTVPPPVAREPQVKVKREPSAVPAMPLEIPPSKPELRPHVDPAFAASSLTLERGESVPSRSVLPFLLTLLLGVAIGFAGGYAVGGRDMSVADTVAARTETAATAGSTGTPPAPPQEFTESAIREVPPDTRAGSPSPAAADAAVPTDAKPAASPAHAPAPAPRADTASHPAATPATPSTGRLLIRSTPAGARVTIDGRDAGRTPVTERSVAMGAHTIRVTRDGYVAEERRVTMTAARPSQTLAFELDRARSPAPGNATATHAPASATPGTAGRYTGALLVESRPTAANVYVDGKLAGKTPVSLESLDAGEHTVHLEMDGYRRWSRSVRVVAGERNKVTASLER